MMTLKAINNKIYDLEDGELTKSTVSELASLYIVRDHMQAAYGDDYDSDNRDNIDSQSRDIDDDMYTVDMQEDDGLEQSQPHLTIEMANQWVGNMVNADGTRGGHWTLEQAKQIMSVKNIQDDPIRFWVAICATYSDFCEAFKKNNVGNNLAMYVDAALAFWLNDEDAVEDKLAAYYLHVVKHDWWERGDIVVNPIPNIQQEVEQVAKRELTLHEQVILSYCNKWMDELDKTISTVFNQLKTDIDEREQMLHQTVGIVRVLLDFNARTESGEQDAR